MNWHKQREILEYIRRQGGLPVDGTGRTLSPDEVLVWFGLDELLAPGEKRQLMQEISAMTEAKALVERAQLRSQR